jgi:hypothetical protein
MTASDIAARLESYNPLLVGAAVFVPAYTGGFGTAADCLREIVEISGTDEELWHLHRPFANVPGYWVIECEPEGEGS